MSQGRRPAGVPAEIPADIPVFPLSGALLLPGGRLPLNIFEPRYLAMTEDALAGGRLLGMIQPDPGLPEGPSGPGLFRVGCLGRITSFSETEDGRFLVTLTGVARFAVLEELEMRRGYRRLRVRCEDPAAPPAPASIPREKLLVALKAYFARRGLGANWEAISRLPDQTLLTTVSMACPFSPAEKQALLEAPGEAERAEALLALLQMGGLLPDEDGPGRMPS
jgi:Lon protease-like protein